MKTTLFRATDSSYCCADVGQDKVVRLQFCVTDASSGRMLQYGNDLVYLHGGYGGAFPKVETLLEGCRVGDCRNATLLPAESYGQRDPNLVLVLPLDEFPEPLPEPGSQVEGHLPDGRSMFFTVAKIHAEHITLDGNHPFAGKSLSFEFEVLEIRDSSETERAAGFVVDAAG